MPWSLQASMKSNVPGRVRRASSAYCPAMWSSPPSTAKSSIELSISSSPCSCTVVRPTHEELVFELDERIGTRGVKAGALQHCADEPPHALLR